MKKYEIVIKYMNACSGSAYPQISFEEEQLNDPDEYIRRKHSHDFDKIEKEITVNGQVKFKYDTGGVVYIYEFTEI